MISPLALNLIPGPTILFVLSRALGQGPQEAVVSVFGLATASVVRAVAAALGPVTLFVYWPPVFAVIQYCGVGYLIYLRITGLRPGW
jgi:threonine/homoserine/homoserine lactone efflux protein